MMTNLSTSRLRLPDDVTLTRLPFGGAVLLHGPTLALHECTEEQATMIGSLLGEHRKSAVEAESERTTRNYYEMLQRLVTEGWLIPLGRQREGEV